LSIALRQIMKIKRIRIIKRLSDGFRMGLEQVWNRFTFIIGKYPSNGVITGSEYA
jgi:hypothetical protein